MKLTNVLLKQHNGWLFKLKWKFQGKRSVFDTGAIAAIQNRGITVKDANNYFNENKIFVHESATSVNHWHPSAFVFNDSNALVYGTKQAQVLTKSVIIDGFPENIEKKIGTLKLPTDIERSMHQTVLVSHLLDAEQKKSPIRVPLRTEKPKHIIPKDYGITDGRKNLLMATRLINHCERFCGNSEALNKKTLNDVNFMAKIDKNGDRFQFDVTAETFISSKKAIMPFKVDMENNLMIPDISPLNQSISIPIFENYARQSYYPIKPSSLFSHPHTVLLNYSSLDVKHLFDEPVTDDQRESRAILKGFTVAASRAQSLYGEDVKTLDQPIVVQVVQIDGRRFHFGIFQLNTLDLDGLTGLKNYWFRKPLMYLYDECIYKEGRPLLTNYNFNIFKLMNIFYSN